METLEKPLARAIRLAGGQKPLADKIGTSQGLVWYWLTKSKQGVPPKQALAIEKATGVSKEELRPDIFGPAPTGEEAA